MDEQTQPEQPLAKRPPGRPRKDGLPQGTRVSRRKPLPVLPEGCIPPTDPMSRHYRRKYHTKSHLVRMKTRVPPDKKLVIFAADFLAYGSAKHAATQIRYPQTTGDRILNLPRTQEILKTMRTRLMEGLEITPQRVARERALIAFANMADYVQVQKDGTAYVDLSRMTRDQAAALSETQVEEYTEGRKEDKREVKRVKIKLHSKNSALDALDKQLGLYEADNKQRQPIQPVLQIQVDGPRQVESREVPVPELPPAKEAAKGDTL